MKDIFFDIHNNNSVMLKKLIEKNKKHVFKKMHIHNNHLIIYININFPLFYKGTAKIFALNGTSVFSFLLNPVKPDLELT